MQVCSKAIPQILGISGIKLAVKGTIVDGEVEQEFSQGPVIEVEGNSLRYYDLFDKVIFYFEDNSVVKSMSFPRSETLSYKMFPYIRKNTEAVKQELWGSTPETIKAEDNVITQHVAQNESDKNNQGTTKHGLDGNKRTETNADGKEKRGAAVNTTGEKIATEHLPVNSGVDSQKEPPIFSRKQKISIAIGVVTALATALVCYLVQLPVWAIIVSALVDGIVAYIVSSRLDEVSICNGAGQQPGF
ncbi:hypothetical protein [Candidatus Wolbachia massiliensis]|uniref:Uncharacterized protein n=1 Tax=Candidatus Wolbachia massiliensis TaxID=1845000 RepID=A0A7L7YQD6_9RICK|nr:hypothetical protein [Candidatus Wolbachia massiliensis]QOD38315.1 hypothetical protein ID128_06130 [Candidatus Wolbachia massiliensis]